MKNWIVKIVQGKYRCWDDFRIYGFISAGHNNPPSDPLRELKKGDRVFAYFDNKGVIAIGIVEREAILAEHCEIEGDFIAKDESGRYSKLHIKDILLNRPHLTDDSNDPSIGEWIVRINWLSIEKKPQKFRKLPDFHNLMLELTDNDIVKEIESRFNKNS